MKVWRDGLVLVRLGLWLVWLVLEIVSATVISTWVTPHFYPAIYP